MKRHNLGSLASSILLGLTLFGCEDNGPTHTYYNGERAVINRYENGKIRVGLSSQQTIGTRTFMIDEDGDKELDYIEKIYGVPRAGASRFISKPTLEDQEIFNRIMERKKLYKRVTEIADTNNDGKLDSNEKVSFCEALGYEGSLGYNYVLLLRNLSSDRMRSYIERARER